MAKPVILVVDDDHEVLGAVERDLRLEAGDLGLQLLPLDLQRLELRLGREVRVGSPVGLVARVGDLAGRSLRGGLVGVRAARGQ